LLALHLLRQPIAMQRLANKVSYYFINGPSQNACRSNRIQTAFEGRRQLETDEVGGHETS
jgi:hypothetical protein